MVAIVVVARLHEGIELLLILRAAKVAQIGVELVHHAVELAALFFKALQFGLAELVERHIAGVHRAAAHIHVPAETAPAAAEFMLDIVHAISPDDVGHKSQANRPGDDETAHHEGDHGRGPGRTEPAAAAAAIPMPGIGVRRS